MKEKKYGSFEFNGVRIGAALMPIGLFAALIYALANAL